MIGNVPSRNTNGTGPYMIKGWEPDKQITFIYHKDWWGKLDGNVTDVTYTPIKSDATRVSALLSGEVDLVTDLPTQDVDRLRKESALKVLDGHEVRTIFIALDQTPCLANPTFQNGACGNSMPGREFVVGLQGRW